MPLEVALVAKCLVHVLADGDDLTARCGQRLLQVAQLVGCQRIDDPGCGRDAVQPPAHRGVHIMALGFRV